MRRFLFAHALLICGLALTLGGELSAGRSAAATRLAAAEAAANAAATAEAAARNSASPHAAAPGSTASDSAVPDSRVPDTRAATMDVALQVNGSPVAFHGKGECHFTDGGSIYEQPARAWGATIDADTRYVNFASWRLKTDHRELMNLMVRIGSIEHRVSTVKAGDHTTSR